MTIGETRTRYRVFDTATREYIAQPGYTREGGRDGWTGIRKIAYTADTHRAAFDKAMSECELALATGRVVIKPVRFRIVRNKASRELARVQAELADANARNERLADALRKAITTQIPQAEKADFMRAALGHAT